MSKLGKCALCRVPEKICLTPSGVGPEFCCTKLYPELLARSKEEYHKKDIGEFARQAAIQEAEGYIDRDKVPYERHPVKTRLEEIIEFSRRMGYRTLGLAFCSGLHREARIFANILEEHGFDVVSVACDVGGIPKEEIGLCDHEKVQIGAYETICNPIGQAEVLNASNTDFNILLGLCVGHDSLFIKYAKGMTTVFAVKDRVLGHNPLAALYTSDFYYERLRNKSK